MKTITVDLPVDQNDLYILPLADLHIGEKSCDMQLIKKQIKMILENDNYYTILNGDIIDNSTKHSIGDVYSQTLTPQEQIELAVKLFEPIKHKILAITNGNHEERTYRESGIDLMSCMAQSLGLSDKYCNEAAYIFLNVAYPLKKPTDKKTRRSTFYIYSTHGRGGGRKEGAKAIRLADMASIVDADIYIHSHTHLPMAIKNSYYKVKKATQVLEQCERLFVNTGASLNYAKYAEKQEFKPSSKSNPMIHIWLSYDYKGRLDSNRKYSKTDLLKHFEVIF